MKTRSNINGKRIIIKEVLIADRFNNLHLNKVPHIGGKPLNNFFNEINKKS